MEIIKTLADKKLFKSFDNNQALFWTTFANHPAGRVNISQNCVWSIAGIPFFVYNNVSRCCLTEKEFGTMLDDFMVQISEQSLPAMWLIGPESKPDNIKEILIDRGWSSPTSSPGMAVEISEVKYESKIPELDIQKIKMPEQQKLWSKVMNLGFEVDPEAIEFAVKIESKLSCQHYEVQERFLGYLNGKPVATGLLQPESGVAGIYCIATLPEFRRQGIGRAMTLQAMVEGKKLGYKIAVLSASEMGRSVYEKLGFREFVSYEQLVWKP